MPRTLSEKPRALVTGASRGIGRAIAVELARAGYPVVLHFKSNEARALEVKAEIEAAGGRAETVGFDIADFDATQRGLAGLGLEARPIGVLVNNAGVTADAPFPAMDRAQWSSVISTTLDGFYNVTQPLVMPMVRLRWGRIVNITSVSGLVGNRGQVNYSAAKAGLIGATKALAQELAKRNITVNAVAPGPVETDMFQGALAQGTPLEEVLKHIPMRRIATVDDVAGIVGFLCSDAASYITGQVVGVNGGMC
ncbi:MAG: 3-oxoacyl-ACP reductase FabG [Deltaproteobacteria bacterium]|jgi:3-oxoacyl-[acyl-carrier protein] reductase